MNKPLLVLVWTTITLAFGMLCWTIWAIAWPFVPINVHSITVEPHVHVKRGDPLWATIDYCKTGNHTAMLYSSIEQAGRVMLIAPQRPVFEQGCHKTRMPLLIVPSIMAIESTTLYGDGKANVEARFTYKVNPLRTITYSFIVGPFWIDP